jgi:hypothetical protein
MDNEFKTQRREMFFKMDFPFFCPLFDFPFLFLVFFLRKILSKSIPRLHYLTQNTRRRKKTIGREMG